MLKSLQMTLLFLVMLATGCNNYKWCYKSCDRKTNECSECNIRFSKIDDCLRYDEHSTSMRCLGGEHLAEKAMNDPVCWKTYSTLGYGKCVEE